MLRQIKASVAFNSIWVVILSTSDTMRDQEQASALGADGYIVKPAGIEAFTEALEALCKTLLKQDQA